MRPLDLALHGVTLSCSVALAAGLWSVSRRERPPAPAPAVSAPSPSPILVEELRQLQDAVGSLRLEIAQLREERGGQTARPLEVPATPAHPGTEPAAAWQAALADPGVQEKLQAVLTARLAADRAAESARRDERRREDGQRWADRRLEEFAQKAGLNDTQKGMLGGLSAEFWQQLAQLHAQVREKALTPEQARESATRAYDELDRKGQAALTADQYAQYRESMKRLQDMATRWGIPGESGSRRDRPGR